MPESPLDHQLEQLLAYHDEPDSSEFVANVMHDVKSEKRTRRAILWAFGLIGAMFGLIGAMMLSSSITQLFTFSITMPAIETTQVALGIVAVVAFYNWVMNDDFALTN